MYIKISGNEVAEALKLIEDTQKKFSPDFPFEFDFIDDEYKSMYTFEQMTGTLFTYFASLAVFISCLGLFGLASFTAEQRTKEIGIRKALGATVPGVILLLSKEFTRWVVIANLIAWPVSYYFMNKFLENYAFRINLGWSVFIVSGLCW